MNAKKELLDFLERNGLQIKCAQIYFNDDTIWRDKLNDYEKEYINLPINYSIFDKETFLKKLDREYDSGWGGPNLFGIVWCTDETWVSRGEYDGSEWWTHNKMPDTPEELLI